MWLYFMERHEKEIKLYGDILYSWIRRSIVQMSILLLIINSIQIPMLILCKLTKRLKDILHESKGLRIAETLVKKVRISSSQISKHIIRLL